jgi:hypothetical protein
MPTVLAGLVLLILPSTGGAQGFIESIAPPVVERGKTTRIVFTGHDLGPGLDVWHSLPSSVIQATPVESHSDRLVFNLMVGENAPVGICGVRVATRDGLTNAHLLLVDDLPVRPRGPGDGAVLLALPAAVWGTFREATLDRYRIEVAAGERISFEAVSNRFGKDADPLVTIRDATGRVVAERDNDPGLYFDSRFAHQFDAGGSYTVEIRDARFKASEHHHYVLRIGRFPAARVAVPAVVTRGQREDIQLPEVHGATFSLGASRNPIPGPYFATVRRPGDQGSAWVPVTTTDRPITVAEEFDGSRDIGLSQAVSGPAVLGFLAAPGRINPFLALDRHILFGRLQATPATLPGVLCGVLRKPGRADAFRLRLQKGERIFLRSEAKSLNSPSDLELVITDRMGKELRRVGETRDEVNLDFTAGVAGDFGLLVRDVIRDGGEAFAYRIDVRNDPFPPRLMAEVEGLSIPQGSYQPIPILVTRAGTAGPIRLRLSDAPPGLKLVPVQIAETETGVVCRLEADASAPIGVHTLQILADTDGPHGREWSTVQTHPLIDRKMVNVDLIPIALREDQVRLPPSLTDRFAVQITPPTPFTFELPESLVTLPRYQKAPIPIVTSRVLGFDGPIVFAATGGQLADKNEGRTRVYAEFPDATPAHPTVAGVVVSKILSNLGKVRIDVTGTCTHQGRRVTLTRTFDLDLTTAFKITADPAKVTLLPGESTKVRFGTTRVKTFDGPVQLHLNPMSGVTLPEMVSIPKGREWVELDIAASSDAQPRQQGITVTATGDVDGFEEEVRNTPLTIDVKKVEPPKKTP